MPELLAGLLAVVMDMQQAHTAKELITFSRQRLSPQPVRSWLPMSVKTRICIGLFAVGVVAPLVSLRS